jgi:hypothetical protein
VLALVIGSPGIQEPYLSVALFMVGCLLLVILIVATILSSMKKKDGKPKRPKPPAIKTGDINAPVGSIGQSGGTTIQNVVGPGHRSMQGHDLAELGHFLAQFAGTAITVICGLGDGEAAVFAEEIKTLLIGAGWQVSGVNQAVRMPPSPPGVGLNFTEGANDPPPWVMGFANRLMAMGFHVSAGYNSRQREVFVGHL